MSGILTKEVIATWIATQIVNYPPLILQRYFRPIISMQAHCPPSIVLHQQHGPDWLDNVKKQSLYLLVPKNGVPELR
jgi:hypothetical protein